MRGYGFIDRWMDENFSIPPLLWGGIMGAEVGLPSFNITPELTLT
jgi:hypothetical protein